jgi:hypothetical protein
MQGFGKISAAGARGKYARDPQQTAQGQLFRMLEMLQNAFNQPQ